MDILQKTADRLLNEKIIEAGDNIVVGLSGGGDSVGLLYVLLSVRQKFQINLTAVHVHHGIRGESADLDLKYCEELCQREKVELITVHANIPELSKSEGISTELAGRRVRKNAFQDALKRKEGKPKLFLAHHANDQEETILMNLLRGTGIAGLAGMKFRQMVNCDDLSYETIRPFLEYEHTEIINALKARGIGWCEDESNGEEIYTRNALRLRIIPQLKELYPGFTKTICRTGKIMSESNEFIRKQAEEFLKANGEAKNGELFVNIDRLCEADIVVAREVVRQSVEKCGGLVDVSFAQVEEILALIDNQSGRSVNIDGGRRVRRSFDRLVFGEEKDYEENTELVIEKTSYSVSEVIKKLENNTDKVYAKWFDCDKIRNVFSGELVVRKPQPDDYLLIDREGHRKKLSTYLKQQKLDCEKRSKINVAAAGNIILAVEGMRDSCGFEVDNSTKNILKIYSREKCNERDNYRADK